MTLPVTQTPMKDHHHHYHRVMPQSRISMTLSLHFYLSFIASGTFSGPTSHILTDQLPLMWKNRNNNNNSNNKRINEQKRYVGLLSQTLPINMNKICGTLLEKQEWSHKWLSPMETYTEKWQCWPTSQNLITYVPTLDAV